MRSEPGVEREVIPNASDLEHADEFPEAMFAQMCEFGLFGATIPENYGGLGLDATTYARIIEELSRGWMSLAGILNTHKIAATMIGRYGTDEQRDRFYPACAMDHFGRPSRCRSPTREATPATSAAGPCPMAMNGLSTAPRCG